MVAASAGRKDLNAAPSGSRPVKLFVGGLTRNTTTKLLREHFAKYGRILDCVAMCQGDGKPRGFGYVTLDSAAAADRCLAEAQVVDGRVVDMKRAVPAHGKTSAAPAGAAGAVAPGGRGERPATAAAAPGVGRPGGLPLGPPSGMWDVLSAYEAQAYASQMAAASAWASAWAGLDGNLDCLDVLRRGAAPPSPCEALNLLTEAAPHGLHGADAPFERRVGVADARHVVPPDAAKPMSAAAPEFVPHGPSVPDDGPQKVALPTPVGSKYRAALGDITNSLRAEGKTASPGGAAKKQAVAAPKGSRGRWAELQIRVDSEEGSDSVEENRADAGAGKRLPLPPGLTTPPGLGATKILDPAGAGLSILSTTPTAAASR